MNCKSREPGNKIIKNWKEKLLKERSLEFAEKVTEHRVKKDLLTSNKKTIEELEKTLNNEKQQLDELQEETYKIQNSFCDSIWNFSEKHDFGNFFVNYPEKKIPSLCNCEFFDETVQIIEKEIQDNEEVQKLIFETTALKLELENLEHKNKDLIEEMKNISKNLQSHDDNKIQRLYEVLQNSQKELESLDAELKYHEKDVLSKTVEMNSTMEIRNEKVEKIDKRPFKKFKVTKEFKSPSLSDPNTIDNYLIVKRKTNLPLVEKIPQTKIEEVNKKQMSKEKTGVLSSWTRNSNISSSNTEISISRDFGTEKVEKNNIFHRMKFTDFKMAESVSNETVSSNAEINVLMSEDKSILRDFTPKKKSVIAEKLSKINYN